MHFWTKCQKKPWSAWGLAKHFGGTCSSCWPFHFSSYSSEAFRPLFFFFPSKNLLICSTQKTRCLSCSLRFFWQCKNRRARLDCKSPWVSTVSMRGNSSSCLRQGGRARKACDTTSHIPPSQVLHKACFVSLSSIPKLDFTAGTDEEGQLMNQSNQPASVCVSYLLHLQQLKGKLLNRDKGCFWFIQTHDIFWILLNCLFSGHSPWIFSSQEFPLSHSWGLSLTLTALRDYCSFKHYFQENTFSL